MSEETVVENIDNIKAASVTVRPERNGIINVL
jgi:hypothetical protein